MSDPRLKISFDRTPGVDVVDSPVTGERLTHRVLIPSVMTQAAASQYTQQNNE